MFGNALSMHLMLLDEKDILHIVDTATHFLAANFQDTYHINYGQSDQDVRLVFDMFSYTIYTDYPNRLRPDQCFIFMSKKWKQSAEMYSVRRYLSRVTAHTFSEIGEHSEEPLKQIFRKIQFRHQAYLPQYTL